MRFIPLIITTLILISADSAADDRVRFNRDIRPILSENCFLCHGPDDNARESDLRFDTEEGAKEYAIVEGDSEASELIARIISKDADLLMPPPDSERSLSPDQIELITKWIDQGANYEGHWSFIPPVRPPLPDSTADSVHPIDQFVQVELDAQGLTPAAAADRETLIRRVTFDLNGLPPTLEEIDAFLSDKSPQSYERLLDRLLAREAFGERMASDWLDAARYSDTYGFQVDRDRFVWPWRDWVIRALNANMPYDEFITTQLAGDLIPGATRDQILATTFNRLHPQKVEGGSTPEEFRVEYVSDRTQTVATAMMGLTYECCRCHNHKYDPISQKEYYQLSAFFDNIDEAGLYSYFTPAVPTPTLALPTPEQEQATEQHSQRVQELELALQEMLVQQTGNAVKRLDSEGDNVPQELFVKPLESLEFEESPKGGNTIVDGIEGNAFQLTGDDGVATKVGNFTRAQPFSASIWIKTPDVKQRAVIFHRSRAWTDAGSRGYQLLLEDGKLSWSLIHFWPGNAIRVRAVQPVPLDQWVHVAVTNDGSSRADGLRIFVNGRQAETETVRDSLTKQITGGGGDTIAIGERFRDRGFKRGCVDRFRVFDCELTKLEIERLSRPDEEVPWLTSATQTPAQRDLLVDHYLQRHDSEVDKVRTRLQQARWEKCQVLDATEEIMVMRERPTKRSTFLLVRGAYDNHGPAVDPATPGALTGFPQDAPRNRLGLAQWLCNPADIHPLTSRVAVNRLWQLCFGRGLVRTPEDFGSQGAPPTHPDLLDWMAVDFVESGWNVKRMLKQIMLSQTYRRSSQQGATSQHGNPSQTDSDPTNRSLARFPTYRMTAEMLRDNALAVSGRLVSKVGGPPVKPYELEASFKPSKRDQGDGLYRRSLYTYWKRTGPAPAMMALDAAKRDVCRVQRERTSSPLQAFVLLNGPQYVEAARGLAERLTIQHGDDNLAAKKSIHDAFRILTSRHGTPAELAVLSELYEQQRAYFGEHEKRTGEFLNVGDASPNDSLSGTHVAAMTVVVGTLLNFDQSMMKR
jgi:hypothetical protein